MKTREDVERALELNGFTLKRDKNHLVYSNGKLNFTLGKTISDRRAFENAYADIRKIVIASGGEFITDEIFKGKPVRNFNTPTIVRSPARPEVQMNQTPPPAQQVLNNIQPPRYLDDAALEICKGMLSNGMTYSAMAEELTKRSYVSPKETVLDRNHISIFMRSSGIRLRAAYTKKPAIETAEPVQNKFLHDISELLTSNLSDSMKEKFIVQMVAERTRT